MLRLRFIPTGKDEINILGLGAHSDDLEIGCSGTILRLLSEYPRVHVVWVVFSAVGKRAEEAKTGAEKLLERAASVQIRLEGFQDGYFPYTGAEIKDYFESLKSSPEPDLIFTHTASDLHQDHRLVRELTWNTFRNHTILEYEVPKYDGDLGSPNVFFPLTEATIERKIDILLSTFSSQRGKRWFTADTFRSLMRIRGMECNSETGYAEAFYGRKLVH